MTTKEKRSIKKEIKDISNRIADAQFINKQQIILRREQRSILFNKFFDKNGKLK